MRNNSAFIYSKFFQNYKFTNEHPFNQLRVDLTYDLLEKLGALKPSQIFSPSEAADQELELIHEPAYINAVKQAGKGEAKEDELLKYGLGTEDTPIFPNMHEASSLIVGATIKAVDLVMQGEVDHALNIGGGLHHGFRNKASGFCIYNDSAIASQYIVEKYNKRVLYVDTDVHHGDGVQWAFYDTSRVCTLSIHETGRYLFPGTGNENERGIGAGYGYSFNVPIDAYTEDESFLAVYEKSLSEIAEFYRPDVLITQNGVDGHFFDPLSHLALTVNSYRRIPKIAHDIAHKYCGGKWIAVGGGGYDIWRVVPRAWSMLWLEMNDLADLAQGDLPKAWIDKWQEKAPVKLPRTWEDDPDIYPPIPRKMEIEEKNRQTVEKTLSLIQRNKG